MPTFDNKAETKSDECSDAIIVCAALGVSEIGCCLSFKDLAKIQDDVEIIKAVESISGFLDLSLEVRALVFFARICLLYQQMTSNYYLERCCLAYLAFFIALSFYKIYLMLPQILINCTVT